ncbi:hypothetical protein LKMONMHP_2627 [Methylobacterium organophilum]|uniref:histidine kinase n=3 Tax=Methylobacterium organophilum TaxID=410 RepID=A0ABQ4T7Z5_METOR|nr:hypothetical protein LKMONMHP_2627 [Methylobacterium organophilum]
MPNRRSFTHRSVAAKQIVPRMLPPKSIGSSETAILTEAGFLGVWDTDARLDLVRCSPGCAEAFGIPVEAGRVGVPLEAFLAGCHPEDRDFLAKAVSAAYADGGGPFEAEYRTIDSEGRVRWVLARGRMTVDEKCQPLASRGILIDVSENRAASGETPDERSRLLERLADHAIAQRDLTERLRMPVLRRLVDALLLETGREIARALRLESRRSLN